MNLRSLPAARSSEQASVERSPTTARAVALLTDAEQRAAEQRIAAEQLLEQARQIEARIAAEAQQARLAAQSEEISKLESAVADLRARENAAARRAEGASSARAAAAETLKAARQAENDAIAAERQLSHELSEHTSARERAEKHLEAARARIEALPERAPSLEVIEELSTLEARIGISAEAAQRIAERRAADEARRAASVR